MGHKERIGPPLDDGFLRGTLGRTGILVHRLGLAASRRPGERAVHRSAGWFM